MNTPTRYSASADTALTYDDESMTWYVVTGPLHPYGVDAIGYPSRTAALKAYRATVRVATEGD